MRPSTNFKSEIAAKLEPLDAQCFIFPKEYRQKPTPNLDHKSRHSANTERSEVFVNQKNFELNITGDLVGLQEFCSVEISKKLSREAFCEFRNSVNLGRHSNDIRDVLVISRETFK